MKPKLISSQEIFMNRNWFGGLSLKCCLLKNTPPFVIPSQVEGHQLLHICQVLDAIRANVFLRSMEKYSVCSKSAEQMKLKTMRGHQMGNNSLFPVIINFAFAAVTSGVMWDDYLICNRGLVSKCQTLCCSFERWSEQMVREVLQKIMQKDSSR